jgi:hypothetical protein
MLAVRIAPTLFLLVALAGCAARNATPQRPFLFYHDSFSFSNQLVWEYRFDDSTRKTTTVKRDPPATYSHHCFVVARAARQFLDHAQFAPEQAVVSDAIYRSLIQQIISRSPREISTPEARITIPGFADLREFSRAKEALLTEECGGAWQSYFQRGHWRMIFPFTRAHQERMARNLLQKVQELETPLVHVVRFPKLSINHAILVFDGSESPEEIRFSVYDPNNPHVPETLTFRKDMRRFDLPRNLYFSGGKVDVYEIYHGYMY